MQQENWEKVKEILQEVLKVSPSERSRFLDKADLNDEVRAELESLLAYESEVENLMDLSAVEFSGEFFEEDEKESQNALIGQNVGIYRIISELGFGGMGAVYLAERTDGKFDQKVALKLLKREMNTGEIRRRFEQERKILASLEHPNIARLLDAGTTDDKIPYLSMEYVEGLPITKYCETQNLSLEARLDLFRSVCSAVNFAHRNLVVHRDLKPSNIFVTKDGVPKLLDFGISKILSDEFESLNAATVTKLGAMTPAYASPEQLQNKSVTTATDIYSLGVILYELLSGHRPFEDKEKDLKEIYRAVLETEPLPPSAMLETSSKSRQDKTGAKPELNNLDIYDSEDSLSNSYDKTESNKVFQSAPKTLSISAQSLRGDLDNIVLKALRKEPERRYLSADDLASDIKSFLRGLPVTARPNTFIYRAEKFLKRNRATVAAAIIILIAIIGGIIATVWQARVAADERDRARLEAEKVKKINAYTQNILNFSNPHWLSSNPQRNREAKISDALDEALKNIDTDLANEPEIQAEILFTIGQTYVSQGNHEKGAQLLQQSIEKLNKTLGTESLKAMQASVILGDAHFMSGNATEAERLYIEAIKYFRTKIVEDKSQSKWLAIALNDRANILQQRDKHDEAEILYQESFKISDDFTGKDRFIIPIILGNRGSLNASRGDFKGAIDFYSQSYDELRRAGNENSFDAGALNSVIGANYTDMGDYRQADVYYQKAHDILMKTVGENDFYTLRTNYWTAYNYYKQQRYEEAENLTSKTLAILHRIYPKGHYIVAWSERLLGEIYTKTGKVNQGESYLRKTLNYFTSSSKEPNRNISQAKTSLAENLIVQKSFAEAEEHLISALDGYIKTKGEDHPFTKQCREILSNLPKQ